MVKPIMAKGELRSSSERRLSEACVYRLEESSPASKGSRPHVQHRRTYVHTGGQHGECAPDAASEKRRHAVSAPLARGGKLGRQRHANDSGRVSKRRR